MPYVNVYQMKEGHVLYSIYFADSVGVVILEYHEYCLCHIKLGCPMSLYGVTMSRASASVNRAPPYYPD